MVAKVKESKLKTVMMYLGIMSSCLGIIGTIADLFERFLPKSKEAEILFSRDDIYLPPPPMTEQSDMFLIIALSLLIIGVIVVILSVRMKRGNKE